MKEPLISLALALAFGAAASSARADEGVVRKAMDDEMTRSLAELRVGSSAPPYYLRYTVTDVDRGRLSAQLGVLLTDDRASTRNARVDVRVGSPEQDNTNFRLGGAGRTAGISLEDDYAAVRRDLWLLTDRECKSALETLAKKKASRTIENADKDKVPDFAKAPSVHVVKDHSTPISDADRAAIKALILRVSRVFREFPTVHSGRVDAEVGTVRRRLLTSEKTWTDERWSQVVVEVMGDTVAEDGQKLRATLRYTSVNVAGLPLDKIEAEARAMAKNLADQRSAPQVEAGSATVLFEGQAAAQLAAMLLAGPLSGQPVPRSAGESTKDGSTSLADKLGLMVAPKWLSVTDDPTALGPGKRALLGAYDSDDEGVPAEKVTLIENGVVKSLLMSRTPRKEISRSNGHGRATWGPIKGSSGSLFVTATGGLDRRKLLAAAVKSAGAKGTVYLVQQLSEASGIGRGQTLQAAVAFRYKDGKEDVVRGLSLEGFSPKKLKNDLIGAGKELTVLDEGSLVTPRSVVTPALLFEDVDVGKPSDKNKKPPLYPSPLALGSR